MSKSIRKQLLTAEEETRFRAMAAKNPRAAQPPAHLALHCWRSGALPEALDWIDRCLEIDVSEVNYYRIRANILVDMKQSAKAVETAIQAIEVAPESVIAKLLTVRMLLADLQPARAQEVLDVTLDLEPETQQLHFMKSLQAQILNMTRQAEHDPLKWLSLKYRKRLANVASET
jgi:tetratricopeptide (TPR) repeat protein